MSRESSFVVGWTVFVVALVLMLFVIATTKPEVSDLDKGMAKRIFREDVEHIGARVARR